MRKRSSFLGVVVAFPLTVMAAGIVGMRPSGGELVRLLPEAQTRVMALPDYDARLAALRADERLPKKERFYFGAEGRWRRSDPVTLEWTCTGAETPPFKVLLGRRPDLSDAKPYFIGKKAKGERGEKGTTYRFEIPLANLEIATDYHWRVIAGAFPGAKDGPMSDVATFRTADAAPRWIALEGTVKNVRDLGGRRTEDGCRVRQGLVFRGQGLNENSVTGEIPGRNRLTVEDVRYLVQELGIRTDLDLRRDDETAKMTVSPLGKRVRIIRNSSPAYGAIFAPAGMRTMAENFRVFCSATNYPVYFHCISGADRTGALAYVLNGALGVSRHELETDWEATFYPTLPEMCKEYRPGYWRRELDFTEGFMKYGQPNDSWRRRVELYLLDCGITADEIAEFRRIMLVRHKRGI